ncbi:MAG: quinolinate synthase NadA [Planctomycetota bacterium]
MQLWQPSLPQEYLSMDRGELASRIARRREQLGDRLLILGHHYQVDDVIRHADVTGDSLKLSQIAAERVAQTGAEFVVFCGVHFMAESADMLAPQGTSVILPDLSAGCSMADMADYEDAVDAWDAIQETLQMQRWNGRVIPITYVNSTAAVKAFVGQRGGACCTSSNADKVFAWAMAGGDKPKRDDEAIKILFLPDQHLGRNTAHAYGIDTAARTCVYDPKAARRGEGIGGSTPEQIAQSDVILWAGHCSVHKLFRPEHCDAARAEDSAVTILVHPECAKEVVDKSDLSGSTEYIIRTIEAAEPGTSWAVGTEFNLVNRLKNEAAARGVRVRVLSDCQCLCTTMYRIDEPHLLWVLDGLVEGTVRNRIEVHPEATKHALVALDRMLSLVEPTPA